MNGVMTKAPKLWQFYQEQSDNDNYYDAYTANQIQEQVFTMMAIYIDGNYYNALPYTKSYNQN